MKYILYDKMWWTIESQLTDGRVSLLSTIFNQFRNHIDIENLTAVEAESISELDWKKTRLFDEESKLGWLSPGGVFTGCEYYFHDSQAKVLHGKEEFELEELGYIKISSPLMKPQRPTAYFTASNNKVLPSLKQIEYLKSRNIENTSDILSIRRARMSLDREMQ